MLKEKKKKKKKDGVPKYKHLWKDVPELFKDLKKKK